MLRLAIALLIASIFVLFSVENNALVSVRLWPLPWVLEARLPVFLGLFYLLGFLTAIFYQGWQTVVDVMRARGSEKN